MGTSFECIGSLSTPCTRAASIARCATTPRTLWIFYVTSVVCVCHLLQCLPFHTFRTANGGSLPVFLFGAFQLYDGLRTTDEPAVTKRKTLRSDSSFVDDVTINAGDMLDEKNPNAQCNLDSCCRSKHRRSTAPLRLCKAGLPSPVITCEKKAAYNSGKLDTISRVRSLIMLT